MDIYPCAKFHCNSFTESLPPNMWNITLLWLFFVVLSWLGLYFFLATAPRSHLWRDFNHLWLKWRVVTQGCAFWRFWWRPAILRGSNVQEPQKGAWLGVFQPNWHNHKIVTYPTAKIGSTPRFDGVVELHSWLRGWSRMTKFKFKLADGRHIRKYSKCYNSPTNGPIGRNLKNWVVASHHVPDMSPWCGCHGNSRCLATAHWALSCNWPLEA